MAYERVVPEFERKKHSHALSSLIFLLGVSACQTSVRESSLIAWPETSPYPELSFKEKTYTSPFSLEEYMIKKKMNGALSAYWSGIRTLQYSAQLDSDEKLAAFKIAKTGSYEWIYEDLKKVRAVDSEDSGHREFTYKISANFIKKVLSETDSGSRVIIFHTHPTHLLKDLEDKKSDTARVPPSPPDMYAALWFASQMSPENFSAISFGVVTERSLWRYGFSTHEALDRFSEAFTKGIKILEREDADEIKNGITFIKNALSEVPIKTDSGTKSFKEYRVKELLESNNLHNDTKIQPRLIVDLRLLEEAFNTRNIPVPEEVGELLALFGEIEDEVFGVFLASDPKTDGDFSMPPILGKFEIYTGRWKGIGANMEEVALPALEAETASVSTKTLP